MREQMKYGSFKFVVKRAIDVTLSLLLLIFLLPLLGLIALVVRFTIGTPILFHQQRPGLHGKPISVYKFRTMTDARDAEGNLLPDADRLTAFGRFLRSTSFDEVPELITVLRGEMSLVGPRPLLPEYLPYYTGDAYHRHDVLPGLTGWAQINGRNAISWEEKFALDVWYINNWSPWLDMKIIALTVWRIIRREGIAQPGQVTTERFR
jgi:sugar transferase EpsL